MVAQFCDDRTLGRLRTTNVALWRMFGYNACWAHLARDLVHPGVPSETPYVTQRAFHRCRVLDVRSSWHDDVVVILQTLRRYEREYRRLRCASHDNQSVQRHQVAKRRVRQLMAQLEWPDPSLSRRQHDILCSAVEHELAVLRELKTAACARRRRLYALERHTLPEWREKAAFAHEQSRKTAVFERYLGASLALYEVVPSPGLGSFFDHVQAFVHV